MLCRCNCLISSSSYKLNIVSQINGSKLFNCKKQFQQSCNISSSHFKRPPSLSLNLFFCKLFSNESNRRFNHESNYSTTSVLQAQVSLLTSESFASVLSSNQKVRAALQVIAQHVCSDSSTEYHVNICSLQSQLLSELVSLNGHLGIVVFDAVRKTSQPVEYSSGEPVTIYSNPSLLIELLSTAAQMRPVIENTFIDLMAYAFAADPESTTKDLDLQVEITFMSQLICRLWLELAKCSALLFQQQSSGDQARIRVLPVIPAPSNAELHQVLDLLFDNLLPVTLQMMHFTTYSNSIMGIRSRLVRGCCDPLFSNMMGSIMHWLALLTTLAESSTGDDAINAGCLVLLSAPRTLTLFQLLKLFQQSSLFTMIPSASSDMPLSYVPALGELLYQSIRSLTMSNSKAMSPHQLHLALVSIVDILELLESSTKSGSSDPSSSVCNWGLRLSQMAQRVLLAMMHIHDKDGDSSGSHPSAATYLRVMSSRELAQSALALTHWNTPEVLGGLTCEKNLPNFDARQLTFLFTSIFDTLQMRQFVGLGIDELCALLLGLSQHHTRMSVHLVVAARSVLQRLVCLFTEQCSAVDVSEANDRRRFQLFREDITSQDDMIIGYDLPPYRRLLTFDQACTLLTLQYDTGVCSATIVHLCMQIIEKEVHQWDPTTFLDRQATSVETIDVMKPPLITVEQALVSSTHESMAERQSIFISQLTSSLYSMVQLNMFASTSSLVDSVPMDILRKQIVTSQDIQIYTTLCKVVQMIHISNSVNCESQLSPFANSDILSNDISRINKLCASTEGANQVRRIRKCLSNKVLSDLLLIITYRELITLCVQHILRPDTLVSIDNSNAPFLTSKEMCVTLLKNITTLVKFAVPLKVEYQRMSASLLTLGVSVLAKYDSRESPDFKLVLSLLLPLATMCSCEPLFVKTLNGERLTFCPTDDSSGISSENLGVDSPTNNFPASLASSLKGQIIHDSSGNLIPFLSSVSSRTHLHVQDKIIQHLMTTVGQPFFENFHLKSEYCFPGIGQAFPVDIAILPINSNQFPAAANGSDIRIPAICVEIDGPTHYSLLVDADIGSRVRDHLLINAKTSWKRSLFEKLGCLTVSFNSAESRIARFHDQTVSRSTKANIDSSVSQNSSFHGPYQLRDILERVVRDVAPSVDGVNNTTSRLSESHIMLNKKLSLPITQLFRSYGFNTSTDHEINNVSRKP